ncbi:hypothetical protein AB0F91_43445 [Amycolatopsis sp. NPDC023774]|uniref:hypothetical protein n=1 Tax=Amycolatopsis sp. NPDC023774 TaxID=3155015 RepID=UPI0033C0D530
MHLGATLEAETRALYRGLAESTTPLGEADLQLLAQLAEVCTEAELAAVPVRENRAVLNAVPLGRGPAAGRRRHGGRRAARRVPGQRRRRDAGRADPVPQLHQP